MLGRARGSERRAIQARSHQPGRRAADVEALEAHALDVRIVDVRERVADNLFKGRHQRARRQPIEHVLKRQQARSADGRVRVEARLELDGIDALGSCLTCLLEALEQCSTRVGPACGRLVVDEGEPRHSQHRERDIQHSPYDDLQHKRHSLDVVDAKGIRSHCGRCGRREEEPSCHEGAEEGPEGRSVYDRCRHRYRWTPGERQRLWREGSHLGAL